MPLYSYNGGLLSADGGLAGSQDCCCGGGGEEPCSVGFSSYGWYTQEGQQDIQALLAAAGYINVTFVPEAPFAGAAIPYTDGCGQTYLLVVAECCGQTFGCSPEMTSGPLRGIEGPGNQFEPCGVPVTQDAFVQTCCASAP